MPLRSFTSFVAQAEIEIDAQPDAIFERLADLATWPSWMPRSFAPVLREGRASTGGERGPLHLGDRFRVKLAGLPFASPMTISICEPPRELAWTAGQHGVLWAEHRFVLEPITGGRTRARSIETWRGALAGASRPIVKPLAEKIGRDQLKGLASIFT